MTGEIAPIPVVTGGDDITYLQQVICDPGYVDGVAQAATIRAERVYRLPFDADFVARRNYRRGLVQAFCLETYDGDLAKDDTENTGAIQFMVMSDEKKRESVLSQVDSAMKVAGVKFKPSPMTLIKYEMDIASTKDRRAWLVNKIRTAAEALPAELADRRDDPDLAEALLYWGRSRDLWDRDNGGEGFNAGVVHYFLYRLHHAKAERWRHLTPLSREPSIEGFMNFSADAAYMLGALPQSETYAAVDLRDEEGNFRRMVLSTYFDKHVQIIANQRAGLDEYLRLVTVLPWHGKNEQPFRRLVERALQTDSETEQKRLNPFHGQAEVISYCWDEPAAPTQGRLPLNQDRA